MVNKLFSPFFWKESLDETSQIENSYLNKILDNYKAHPNLSPDWDVHTSYNNEKNLLHPIDWWDSVQFYRHHVNKFIKSYFGVNHDWEICGSPWYTAYGKNQYAERHEHFPDHFSFVHFLKFNPNVHSPITFVNPNSLDAKGSLQDKNFKDKIDFNNIDQSLYHPLYSPLINQGDYIIFNSNLEHFVEKSQSDELRITIAFNIKIK